MKTKTSWGGSAAPTGALRRSLKLRLKQLEQERLELVCLGLDTVARLEVNGERVAETKNMHRAYRFDVKPLLKTGENTLSVTFAAPVTYAERCA